MLFYSRYDIPGLNSFFWGFAASAELEHLIWVGLNVIKILEIRDGMGLEERMIYASI